MRLTLGVSEGIATKIGIPYPYTESAAYHPLRTSWLKCLRGWMKQKNKKSLKMSFQNFFF